MRPADLFLFSLRGLGGHGLRTALCLTGVTIGVAAVVLLTGLGEGARRYVVDQFASLGTNLLIVMPGRTDTTGGPGVGGVPNDLTLLDTQALSRHVRGALRVAPIAMGTEEVAYGERRRQVAVLGTTADYMTMRRLSMQTGEFLPAGEMFRGSTVAVLGRKVARELFPGRDPIGEVVRIGGWRMRVIGVMAKIGVKLGVDFDDIVLVPVATAMKMLNRSSLFRILVEMQPGAEIESVRTSVLAILAERHDEEDVTVVTQDAVLSTFSAIFNALTLTVAAIAAISLTVAGIGIMNVMLVSVSERTREVGLLKAVGVARRQILAAFLLEAALVSSAGGVLGVAAGWTCLRVLVRLYPALPASPPAWAVAASLGVSVIVGITFGFLPARRATRLDPVAALAGR